MHPPRSFSARRRLLSVATLAIIGFSIVAPAARAESVARMWNEELLSAIRKDFARPTVHARNLYHVSLAMYDAWAAFDDTAVQILANEHLAAADVESARHEAISFAAFATSALSST